MALVERKMVLKLIYIVRQLGVCVGVLRPSVGGVVTFVISILHGPCVSWMGAPFSERLNYDVFFPCFWINDFVFIATFNSYFKGTVIVIPAVECHIDWCHSYCLFEVFV